MRPSGEFDSTADYLPQTNILVTRFRTRDGILKLTDFMPVPPTGPEETEEARHTLIRIVEVERGAVDVEILCTPRFDYARADGPQGPTSARGPY